MSFILLNKIFYNLYLKYYQLNVRLKSCSSKFACGAYSSDGYQSAVRSSYNRLTFNTFITR